MQISIEHLSKSALLEYFLSIGAYPSTQMCEERAKKLSTYALFVTCRDDFNHLIGVIGFYNNQPPTSFITHVSVIPDKRNFGIGNSMIKYLIDHTKHTSFEYLKLEVKNDNIAAIKLYAKYGFERICEASKESSIMQLIIP